MSLDQPLIVVFLPEVLQCVVKLLKAMQALHPKDLFFHGSYHSLRPPTRLGLLHVATALSNPQKSQLFLKPPGHELAPVAMAKG